jgi:tetratricopeptide (TPR) repeat protein
VQGEEEGGQAASAQRAPDFRRAVVAAVAVLLAVSALGLLIWALASPGQLAWLTSISNVLAADLAAWTASVVMMAWVIRSRRVAADASPAHVSSPPDLGSEPVAGARGVQVGSSNVQVNQFFGGKPLREAAVTGSVADGPFSGEQDGGYALAGRGGSEVPRQLPAMPSDFTGRVRELGGLAALCSPAGGQDLQSPAVVVIYGPPGSGKSALALRLCRDLAEKYPDGQLYCSLRGEQGPLLPKVVLAGFLRALGVTQEEVPHEVGEQAARYRSFLARRRVLILLDGAINEAQVRPLLPGDGQCLVIVTSRNPLRVLEGLEGAASRPLGLLDPDEAMALLTRIAGPDKIRADPAAGERIVQLCGRLPLAVRIAGARLRARPDWSAEYLAGRLSDTRRRLAELRAGDLDVRASLELSYCGLDADAARLFRLLPATPGATFSAGLAAALVGLPEPEADDLLDQLVLSQLAEPAGAGRYQMHDLTRLAGGEFFAEARDRGEAGEDPLSSVFLWYMDGLAQVAGALLARRGTPGLPDPPGGRITPAEALAWLDAEETNLLEVFERSQELEYDEYTMLAAKLMGILAQYRGLWEIRETVLDAGVAAARRLGDRRQLAGLLFERGEHACDWEDSWGDAVGYWTEALTLLDATSDMGLAASLHNRLAQAYRALGRHADAERELAVGTAAAAAVDPEAAEGGEASFRATKLLENGQYHAAVRLLEPLEATWADTQPRGKVPGRLQLAKAYHGVRDYAKEIEQLVKCRELCDGYGLRSHQPEVCLRLGVAYRSQGSYARARDVLAPALESAQASGDQWNTGRLAFELAENQSRDGDKARACDLFTRSADAFTAAGQWLNRAGALHRLARHRFALGDRDGADTSLTDAIAGLEHAEDQEAAERNRCILEETRTRMLGTDK